MLAGDSQALTPAIDGNVVFFCGGYEEKERSQIYALELQTGRLKWQFNAGSCGSPPLISGGTVVAFTFAGHGDHIVLFGLDKDSGGQKWKLELPGNPHPPAPALAGDFIFFAPGSRSVLRIDARDGSVQSFDIDADLSVAAESLWVASVPGGAIFGYGQSYWRSRIGGDGTDPGPTLSEAAGRPTGVASNGHILLLGDDEGNLRAFDLGKGSVIWRHHWNNLLSAPLLAGDKVFVNVYEQKYALTTLELESGARTLANPGQHVCPLLARREALCRQRRRGAGAGGGQRQDSLAIWRADRSHDHADTRRGFDFIRDRSRRAVRGQRTLKVARCK